MKKYKFLLKPIFFIFNLLFATWLVLSIEKIKPSDFGEHKKFFEAPPKPRIVTKDDKAYLRTLALEFKYGMIDSVKLERKLDKFLAAPTDEQMDVAASKGNKEVSVK